MLHSIVIYHESLVTANCTIHLVDMTGITILVLSHAFEIKLIKSLKDLPAYDFRVSCGEYIRW